MEDHHEEKHHKDESHKKHENHESHESHKGHESQENHGSHEDSHNDQHSAHAAHSPAMFRQRFWLSLGLTIPVLIYSHHIQQWFNFHPPHFTGDQYVPFVLSTIIFFYGGLVFIRAALHELKARRPGMMTLISLAISVAYIYSVLVTFGLPGEEIFWELATLVTIMLLGHWIEMNAVSSARGALQELAKLIPDTALLITEEGEKEVPVSSLKPGDIVLVRPGSSLPADGKVVRGESYVNEAVLTGESKPIPKKVDDQVIAGSLNEDGSLRVEVQETAGNTVLAGIMRLVEQAQTSRSRTQILADKAAFYLTIIALSAALVTALVWTYFAAGSVFIMERVVTVLVIACPHALGLAIPLVVAISTTIAARNGLLVKDRLALEKARLVDCVVFDKTGTLTSGELSLVGIHPLSDSPDEDELLRLAAAAEKDSEHSIARSIVVMAKERKLNLPDAESFTALPGRGVKAELEGKTVYVGGPNLLEKLDLKGQQAKINTIDQEVAKSGHGLAYVVIDGLLGGYLTFSDKVRFESIEAVKELQQLGIKVVILTGDSKEAANSAAEQLQIEDVYAGILPENKAEIIGQIKKDGYTVAMVGDGVNDAPALIVADIGLAIGAGTDVAVESAGIILVKNDPRDVVRLIELSRRVYSKMIQNLAWATGYNLLAIPLAAGILAPVGFVMPMAVGAVVMSASTIIVALNAQLLRRVKLASLHEPS
jgi:P-type Cu2+ transporter